MKYGKKFETKEVEQLESDNNMNHGKSFEIKEANQLESDNIIPTRNKLLDESLFKKTETLLAANEAVYFLGNDVAQSVFKKKYELILHGITPCGSKTTITIKGIFPYVDVATNARIPTIAQVSQLSSKLTNHDIDFKEIVVVSGKNFMKFHDKEREYLRVYFYTLKHRSDFINLCIDDQVSTFSNDRSTYYRVVARNYEFNLSGWNIVSNYTLVKSATYKSQFCLEIDVHDIRSFDPDTQLDVLESSPYPKEVFKYENMILSSFDIEMIPHRAGHFPDADKCALDSIFMICVTFHLAKRAESLLNVCLTLKEADAQDNMMTIVCANEACLLEAFSKLFDLIQPEFITEFNGGGFDWRNIISKVRHFGVLPPFLRNMSIIELQDWEVNPDMLKRYFQEKKIKISGAAADSIVKSLKMQGFVNFDTLVIFRQLEPNADSHKLNECLKRCNLGTKDDMDIQDMFNIYRYGTSTEMKLVAHYCFIDTYKLQALLLKKNVVQDRREVSILSMTSIGDAFNFANGSKVRNIMMNVGEKQGYKFDTTYKPTVEDPDAKFQGAHVVPPIKGIVRPMWSYPEFVKEMSLSRSEDELQTGHEYIYENYPSIEAKQLDASDAPESVRPYIEYMLANKTQRPISGLDFASLYPSMIMAYNISPETLITDPKYAQKMEADGHKLLQVNFQFLNREWNAWFVQHGNDTTKYGLCPAILIELFAKRAKLKQVLKPYGKLKFDMEIEMKEYARAKDYPRIEEYNQVCFDYGYFDAKQKALKIFMNTFYGEMGNFLSFVCAVETAASVTAMGRYNLLLAKEFVETQLGMTVYYGDSVVGDTPIMLKRIADGKETSQLVPIEEIFTEFDRYHDGKEYVDCADANLYVMTEKGYTKINKVIRHKTNKQLYRVTTQLGSVIVTEDHSLLNADAHKIKPEQCELGTKLLHWNSYEANVVSDCSAVRFEESDLDALINLPLEQIADNITFVQGVFLASGCDSFAFTYPTLHNEQHCSLNLNLLNKLTNEWRSEFYSARNHKKVPQFILQANRQDKLSFLQGYYAGVRNQERNRSFVLNKKENQMIVEGQLATQGLLLLLLELGYRTIVDVHSKDIYILTFTKDLQQCVSDTAIKSIEKLGPCDGYVYDLETESHHFAAGVGQLVVHNTDSLYVTCNDKYFSGYDREYFSGRIPKLQYCTELVRKTFELIEIAKTAVNNHLEIDNGTTFVKMAYEEVLFPAVFVSKKKYFGIPHEDEINFYPKKPFLRGLELVKRGVSDVLKNIGNQIVLEILDINTTCDMLTLVEAAIKRFFTTAWDVRQFAKTAVYRPDKNNISVQTMISRYLAEGYPQVPEPNVRFKYMNCKKYSWNYNARGCQTILKTGDRMELYERVLAENIPIDLEYYFNNELTGQMARFIAFYDQFDTLDHNTLDESLSDKLRYEKIEEAIFKNAKKYIAELAKQYSNPYQNKGKLAKNIYKVVAEAIRIKNKKTKIVNAYSRNVTRVIQLLGSCASEPTLEQLRTCIQQYISKKYKIDTQISNLTVEELYEYLRAYDLFQYLKDCSEQWIENTVIAIKNQIDFQRICIEGRQVESALEIFTKEELRAVVEQSYEGLAETHATAILEIVQRIVVTLE